MILPSLTTIRVCFFGDVALGQADVVLVDAADGDLFALEVEPLRGAALFRQDDAE